MKIFLAIAVLLSLPACTKNNHNTDDLQLPDGFTLDTQEVDKSTGWPFQQHSNSNSSALRAFSNVCLTVFPDVEAIRAKSYHEKWVAGSGNGNWLVPIDGSEAFLQIDSYNDRKANIRNCTMSFSYPGLRDEVDEIERQLGLDEVIDSRSSGPITEKMWSSKYLKKNSKIMIAQGAVGGETQLILTISSRLKK